MAQYIDKSALVAEIEKERDKAYPNSDWNHGYNTACEKILSFLDTLEVKEIEEEPVNRTPADVESAMQEVEEKSRAFTEAHQGEDTDTILAQMRGEEPINEELEEAAWLYYDKNRLPILPEWDLHKEFIDFFKAGAKWGKNKAKIEIQAQSMALAHGCPKVSVSEDLEAAVEWFNSVKYKSDLSGTPINAFKAGAKWQKVKTLSNVKKAITGKMFQFSMDNVEAWGDDSNGNGKTIKLKGRITFRVSNPESIIDALISELENDN